MPQGDGREQAPFKFTQNDRVILGLLQQDARRTISEIATVTGLSRATVRDRIDLMRESGVIRRFTIEIAEPQKEAPAYGSAFFQLRLKRPVCRIIYAAVNGWPELLGCWSIAGDLDMIVLIGATSNYEIERLRDKLARHPEVKTLTTLTILREWTNNADFRNSEMLDGLKAQGARPMMEPRITG